MENQSVALATGPVKNLNISRRISKKFAAKKKKNKNTRRGSCYKCHSPNHYQRDCPLKVPGRSTGEELTTTTDGSDWKVALTGFKDEPKQTDMWNLDSGCTDHMNRRRESFSNYTEFEEPVTVTFGDGGTQPAYGYGNIDIETLVADKHINDASLTMFCLYLVYA